MRFVITWVKSKEEKCHEEFDIEDNATLDELKELVRTKFNLSSCTLLGLKQRVFEKGNKRNANGGILKRDYAWKQEQDKQYLVAVGQAADVVANLRKLEHTSISNQDEMFEEELDYETVILPEQYKENERRLGHSNDLQYQSVRRILETKNRKHILQQLCFHGNVDVLVQVWEPCPVGSSEEERKAFHQRLLQYATFAAINDKSQVLAFLQKKHFDKDGETKKQFVVLCIQEAASCGHIKLIANLLLNYEQVHKTTLALPRGVFENALSFGHLRLSKWLYRHCQFEPKMTTIFERCLLQVCHRLYVRTLKWILQTFPNVLATSTASALGCVQSMLSAPRQMQKLRDCVSLLLEHEEAHWSQSQFESLTLPTVDDVELYRIIHMHGARLFPGVVWAPVASSRALEYAVAHQNLELIEFFYAKRLEYSGKIPCFSLAPLLEQTLRDSRQDQKSQEVALFLLLHENVLKDTEETRQRFIQSFEFVRSSKSKKQLLCDVLKARQRNEEAMEHLSRNAFELFDIALPLDIIRLITDFATNSDGRNTTKFQEELDWFIVWSNT